MLKKNKIDRTKFDFPGKPRMVKYPKKKLRSPFRNINKFKQDNQTKYQVRFQFKNTIYGNDKIFTDEHKAVLYRNKLWKQHHPQLYKEQFPSEYQDTSSSEEDSSSLKSVDTQIIFQMPKKVPDSAKRVLFNLQNNTCPICRKDLKCDDGCHLDHIYPKQYGGPHEMRNFQMLHYNCHQMKTDIIDKNSQLKTIFKDNKIHIIDKIKAVQKMQFQVFA